MEYPKDRNTTAPPSIPEKFPLVNRRHRAFQKRAAQAAAKARKVDGERAAARDADFYGRTKPVDEMSDKRGGGGAGATGEGFILHSAFVGAQTDGVLAP